MIFLYLDPSNQQCPFLSVLRNWLSYLDIFPVTPLILVVPPVCAVLPINTLTKVAADHQYCK